MEIIDIAALYAAKQVATTVDTGDVFLLGRPNSQRGDGYSVLAINEADLVSYVLSKAPTPPSGSVSVEQGAFTVSADGSTVTGGTIVDNLDGTFTLTIPTIKKMKLGFFNTQDGSSLGITSFGKGNNLLQDCITNTLAAVTMVSDFGDIINIQPGGKTNNGWQNGVITSIGNTSFDILLTQVGTGIDITCQYHLITG